MPLNECVVPSLFQPQYSPLDKCHKGMFQLSGYETIIGVIDFLFCWKLVDKRRVVLKVVKSFIVFNRHVSRMPAAPSLPFRNAVMSYESAPAGETDVWRGAFE